MTLERGVWCVGLALGVAAALGCDDGAAAGRSRAPAVGAADSDAPSDDGGGARMDAGERGQQPGGGGSGGGGALDLDASSAAPHDAGEPVDAGYDGATQDAQAAADASPPDGGFVACLSGGKDIDSDATGACDDPIVLDLEDEEIGDAFVHVTPKAATNGLPEGIGKCAASTERDVVYQVKMPKGADLEVGVDGSEDADPIILVQDGPDETCTKAAPVACIDDHGADQCELLRIAVASGDFDDDTVQVVIAETVASETTLRVRFRLVDAAGGS
jgi:hypothetical protein